MQLHTEKLSALTYWWAINHEDQRVGYVIRQSTKFGGANWIALIVEEIKGDNRQRILEAAHRIRYQIQAAVGHRKKDVIFLADVDQDTPIENIKKRVFTIELALR